ncbi:MAG: ACT domain-containing protein [Myxococcota bacterium]
MSTQLSNRIVLHVAGADRPGVTSRITEIVAAENAELVDMGQSVLHGYLMLSAIVDIPPGSTALRKILFAVADLGLRLEAMPLKQPVEGAAATSAPALCVTLLGSLNDGVAVARLTQFMASRGMNIREIRSLNEESMNTLELLVDLPGGPDLAEADVAALHGDLLRGPGPAGNGAGAQVPHRANGGDRRRSQRRCSCCRPRAWASPTGPSPSSRRWRT